MGKIKHDVHGKHLIDYNVFKNINKNRKDAVHLNTMLETAWIDYYKAPWYNDDTEADFNMIEEKYSDTYKET